MKNLTLKHLNIFYNKLVSEKYPQSDIDRVKDLIEMKESLLEDTSATGGPAVSGSSVPSSGGVAYSNASTAGMGPVISSQPSAFPGALNGVDWMSGGGKDGSGDISVPYNPSGKNRVFQKVPSPLGKNHGANTGKKSRNKPLDIKNMREIFKKNKSNNMDNTKKSGTKRVMSFDDFAKGEMNKVTKVKEGNTFKAVKDKYSDKVWDVKKTESFKLKVENYVKSLNIKSVKVGNDLEIRKDDNLLCQVLFRNDYVGIKKSGNKFVDEFKYEEFGKIKSKISEIIKSI